MSNLSEKQFNELSKQAYADSINSCKANQNKYKYKTDPILQQTETYVSLFIHLFNSLFKILERTRI